MKDIHIKNSWPSLEGRLKHVITSRIDGLKQFQKTNELSDNAKKELEYYENKKLK